MAGIPQRRGHRGQKHKLHDAISNGSVKRAVELLSRGSIDVDEMNAEGCTPLITAASLGHTEALIVPLSSGADVSLAGHDNATALHASAQVGHLDATKVLVDAGAPLEARTSDLATPLHLAAHQGHPRVMRVLIEAGARINTRLEAGETPLYSAAFEGHADAVVELLRAGADTSLRTTNLAGKTLAPFAVSAGRGHSHVVSEMMQQVGIEGCGGPTAGVDALHQAAQKQRLGILKMLADAGVVDTGGQALAVASELGREDSVKFLLRHRRKAGGVASYVRDTRDPYGRTPLLCTIDIGADELSSPRIARMLIDAGADTVSTVRVLDMMGMVMFDHTPLAIVNMMLYHKVVDGQKATAAQLHKLEAIRRLILTVHAARAVSWSWGWSDAPSADSPAVVAKGSGTTKPTLATKTPITRMLTLLRRRAQNRRVILAALSRWEILFGRHVMCIAYFEAHIYQGDQSSLARQLDSVHDLTISCAYCCACFLCTGIERLTSKVGLSYPVYCARPLSTHERLRILQVYIVETVTETLLSSGRTERRRCRLEFYFAAAAG